MQRFLVPVQLPPQNTGQEHAFSDPPSDDNERVEDEIPAMVDLDPSAIVPEDENDVEPMVSENLFQVVGTWPTSIPDALRVELVFRGSLALLNKDGPFPLFPDTANKNRSLNCSWFYRTLGNGEQLFRTSLVYSPLFNCLQCFVVVWLAILQAPLEHQLDSGTGAS